MSVRATLWFFLMPSVAFAADQKPDFKLSAEAYAKEFKTDGKAASEKYKNKLVELTATVHRLALDEPGEPFVFLRGFRAKPDDVIGTDMAFGPGPKEITKHQNLRALAPGQKLTVRGVQSDREVPALINGGFVEVGPSPAQPVTVTGLQAAASNPKTRAKYEDKWVVVRAKVTDVELENARATFTLTDPMGKGAVVQASADCLNSKGLKAEFAAIKKGDMLIVLAKADPLSDRFRLWDAVLLKEPPAGVKVPGDKK